MNDNFFLSVVIILLFAGLFVLGTTVGASYGDHGMKQQAVDAGKAMWVVDQKTAQRLFIWK